MRAALWAVDEAIRHDTTLLLVHVIGHTSNDHETVMAKAKSVLTEAWEAVAATGKPVKVESDVAHGDTALQLVEASRIGGLKC